MTEIKNMMTTGNMLTAGAMLVAIAMSWGDAKARSDQNATDIARMELQQATAASKADARLTAMDTKISVLSEQSGRFDERLANILTYVQRIDATLTAIENGGSNR